MYDVHPRYTHKTEAQCLVSDCWDKVDYGIGLPYRPNQATYRPPCGYDNPMPELTLSPIDGSMISGYRCRTVDVKRVVLLAI